MQLELSHRFAHPLFEDRTFPNCTSWWTACASLTKYVVTEALRQVISAPNLSLMNIHWHDCTCSRTSHCSHIPGIGGQINQTLSVDMQTSLFLQTRLHSMLPANTDTWQWRAVLASRPHAAFRRTAHILARNKELIKAISEIQARADTGFCPYHELDVLTWKMRLPQCSLPSLLPSPVT